MSTQQQILEAITKLLNGEITDMPAYVGTPPFTDTKADELYMLFYQLKALLAGGGKKSIVVKFEYTGGAFIATQLFNNTAYVCDWICGPDHTGNFVITDQNGALLGKDFYASVGGSVGGKVNNDVWFDGMLLKWYDTVTAHTTAASFFTHANPYILNIEIFN